MSEAYFGEIRMFSGNFAPVNWALCNGQLLPIAQNTALFSLLGTTYGGDGRSTFALPDLRGRAPMHEGEGPGLTPRSLGESGGAASVTLLTPELPPHTHQANGVAAAGSTNDPTNAYWAEWPGGGHHGTQSPLYTAQDPNTPMNQMALSPTGGSQPHNNMQPYVGVNFIICIRGIFPPRS